MYNNKNIFAKIINGDLPCSKILETKNSLSFYDINPIVKIHALVVPKGSYIDYSHFIKEAPSNNILDFNKCILDTINKLELNNGYRIISNSGEIGRQEVPHLHFHILGGEILQEL